MALGYAYQLDAGSKNNKAYSLILISLLSFICYIVISLQMRHVFILFVVKKKKMF